MSASFIFRNRILLSDGFSEGSNLFPKFADPLLRCWVPSDRRACPKAIEIGSCPELFGIEKRVLRFMDFQEQLNQRDIYLIAILNVPGSVSLLGNTGACLFDNPDCLFIRGNCVVRFLLSCK